MVIYSLKWFFDVVTQFRNNQIHIYTHSLRKLIKRNLNIFPVTGTLSRRLLNYRSSAIHLIIFIEVSKNGCMMSVKLFIPFSIWFFTFNFEHDKTGTFFQIHRTKPSYITCRLYKSFTCLYSPYLEFYSRGCSCYIRWITV